MRTASRVLPFLLVLVYEGEQSSEHVPGRRSKTGLNLVQSVALTPEPTRTQGLPTYLRTYVVVVLQNEPSHRKVVWCVSAEERLFTAERKGFQHGTVTLQRTPSAKCVS